MNTPTTPDSPNTPDTPDLPEADVADVADVSETAAVPTEDTLADEVFVDEGRTTTWAPAAPAGPATATTATAPAPAPAPAAGTPPEQQWLQGPAPFALVLGLLGLVVAASTLLAELVDVTVPWNDLGPWSVVAAGIVVLLVGAIGLRSSRSRS